MPQFGKDLLKDYYTDRDKQRAVLQKSISKPALNEEERKLAKFIDLVNQISKNKDPGSKQKALDSYMSAVGDYANTNGSSASAIDHISSLGVESAEGLRGVGLGFFAVIDTRNTLSIIKDNKNRNKTSKSLKFSLKKLASNPKGIFKLRNKTYKKENLSKVTYEATIDKLINSKDMKTQDIKKNLNLAIALKEHQNNELLKKIGTEYGFIKIAKDKSHKDLEFYEVDSSKIPEAISGLRKEIENIKYSDKRLGHGLGHKVKSLEEIIKKVQLIQVYDSIKAISDLRNKSTSTTTVLNSLKVAADVVGFAGIVGMMAVPPSVPVTIPMFATGVIVRSSSTLALFVKGVLQNKSVKKTQKNAKEIDDAIKSSSTDLLGDLSEPIMAEKFPNTFKLFMEALNEYDKPNSFSETIDEKILQKFEERVLSNMDKNPALKNEWNNLREDWDTIKKELYPSSEEISVRVFCEQPIKELSKFLIDEVKNIKELETAKNINDAIDGMIHAMHLSEILNFSGIGKQGLSPNEFIRQSINAHQESSFQREGLTNQTVQDINIPNIVSHIDEKMKELLSNGKSLQEATSSISHEIEKLLHEHILSATKKTEEISDSQKLAVLQNKLESSIKSMI